MSNSTSSLKIAMIANVAYVLAGIVATYVTLPLSVQKLGNEKYGYWLMLMSVLAFLPLLQLGLPTAAARLLSSSDAEGKEHFLEQANRIRSIFALLGILILSIGCLIGATTMYIGLGDHIGMTTFALVSAAVGSSVAMQAEEAILVARDRHITRSVIHTMAALTRTVLTVVVLYCYAELIALALVQVVVGLTTLVSLSVCGQKEVRTKIALRLPQREWVVAVVKESMVALLLTLGLQFSQQAATVAVGVVHGAATVPFYTVSLALGTTIIGVGMSVSTVMLPRFSKLHVRGDKSALHNLSNWSFRVVVVFAMTASLCLAVLSTGFVSLWISPSFAHEASSLVWPVSLLVAFFTPVRCVLFPLLLSRKDSSTAVIMFSISLVASVVMMCIPTESLATNMWLSILPIVAFSIYTIFTVGRESWSHADFWTFEKLRDRFVIHFVIGATLAVILFAQIGELPYTWWKITLGALLLGFLSLLYYAYVFKINRDLDFR